MAPRAGRSELVAVFTGGMLGALARVGIGALVPLHPGSWPWTVFVINISGAFLLGYVVVRVQHGVVSSAYWHRFVGTGFCGAYTTFATVQLELLRMLDRRAYVLALAYALATIACGYLAVLAAATLARRARVLA